MKTENEFYPVMIKCPNCETTQAAIVEKTPVWYIYNHTCTNCKYDIMESEWNEIKPFQKL